jgi:hypothetical protein
MTATMTDQAISLGQQAAAVRRAAVNHNGHVNNLRELVARKQRPQHELDIAAQWLPALIAAAATLEKLSGADEVNGGRAQ